MTEISEKKMKLLDDFKRLSEGKKSEELIPLVLAFIEKAKKEEISFSKEEITFLLNNKGI